MQKRLERVFGNSSLHHGMYRVVYSGSLRFSDAQAPNVDIGDKRYGHEGDVCLLLLLLVCLVAGPLVLRLRAAFHFEKPFKHPVVQPAWQSSLKETY